MTDRTQEGISGMVLRILAQEQRDKRECISSDVMERSTELDVREDAITCDDGPQTKRQNETIKYWKTSVRNTVF
jgi:hypothetical protein